MVQWLTLRLPSYKMKCPSLRKMTRNEEFFGGFDSRRARFFFFFHLSADFDCHDHLTISASSFLDAVHPNILRLLCFHQA